MWSLATEDRKGIDNRQEAIPLTIDPQYTVGFTWARQYGFRVVKNFGDKFALAIALEGPQATIGGRGFSNVTTINNGAAPSVISTDGWHHIHYREHLPGCDWSWRRSFQLQRCHRLHDQQVAGHHHQGRAGSGLRTL